MELIEDESDRRLPFSTRRVNATTFVIREDDAFDERPLIYVKLHPRAPVIIVTDTGCDRPRKGRREDPGYVNLRKYIENVPLAINNHRPLNPASLIDKGRPRRRYVIVCTHCHFDHIGGIEQFLSHRDKNDSECDGMSDEPSGTEIVASAVGRDFIEHHLYRHGIFDEIECDPPVYRVTKFAAAFERLFWPMSCSTPFAEKASTDTHEVCFPRGHKYHRPFEQNGHRHQNREQIRGSYSRDFQQKRIDLGMTIIHTPGHTPDELAWYDHDERHLFVGDSFYECGKHQAPIIWPNEGNLIEWAYSMQKLRDFVRAENMRLEDGSDGDETDDEDGDEDDKDGDDGETGYEMVKSRVRISCGHETVSADAQTILDHLHSFWTRALHGEIAVVKSAEWRGEMNDVWQEADDPSSKFIFRAPRRLMEDARRFFGVRIRTS